MAPIGAKAETLRPMDLHLVMSMGGLTAGSLMLSIDPKDDRIESVLKMKSQGLFKFVTGYKSRAEAKSTPEINGKGPMPVSYDTTYETKNTERKVSIRYDAGDGQITDLKTWKRGKPRKSKVPEELRLETIDPLTAVLQLRHWIREMREAETGKIGENVSDSRAFEIFDGRRRYRLSAELLSRRRVTFDGEKTPALRFKVLMEPLAGFSKKDMLANWASEDGKRWIEMVVTDDDDPLPISLTTKGGTLKTSVYLRKVCINGAKCRKVDS
ncbi:MAG: DUF3108 domain-containing protein [Alphaproteobacteria bacterium]|nr:DUF3108 domain-containing protein [Alphaproteobacteria bacterium]